MTNCCIHCFDNKHIKARILHLNHVGNCDYCGSTNVPTISTEEIGVWFRECIDKAYEDIGAGSGAIYDSEDKEYIGGSGKPVTAYSIREILVEDEMIFSSAVEESTLLDDIFEDSGPSVRDIQHGDSDPYGNIDDESLVLKNGLFSFTITQPYIAWETFKFAARHFNRFFDINENSRANRLALLERLKPTLVTYEATVSARTPFFRVRPDINTEADFDAISPYKDFGPPPARSTRNSRMSPAGISYLYLSSDTITSLKECRCAGKSVAVAQFEAKKNMKIIDFSCIHAPHPYSIFDDNYDADSPWIANFLNYFSSDISIPVNENTLDHSYEYTATQIIAEYIRKLGYDGICYTSSVGTGKSYVFFCGPNTTIFPDAYGFFDPYISDSFSLLTPYTDWFCIKSFQFCGVNINPYTIKEITVADTVIPQDNSILSTDTPMLDPSDAILFT